MSYAVLTAKMNHDSTQDSVLKELDDKINDLGGKGWICVADVVYHKNAVSQIMIPIATSGGDVALMRPAWDKHWALGSFKPRTLTYEMGGFGHSGIKTKYENGVYFDS